MYKAGKSAGIVFRNEVKMALNFKMSELIHSDIAAKHKINNMPDINSLDNMLDLITYCLQPIREKIGKPMIITSGYRCSTLNNHPEVRGVKNSQHTTGQAVDFVITGLTPDQIIEKIKSSGVEFDQLINEYNRWVHISFNKGKNRHKVLRY